MEGIFILQNKCGAYDRKRMKGTLSCHHTCWVHKDGLHLSRKNKGSVFSCLTFSSKLQPTNTLNFFVFVVGTRYYTIWKKEWASLKKISKIKEHDSLNYKLSALHYKRKFHVWSYKWIESILTSFKKRISLLQWWITTISC